MFRQLLLLLGQTLLLFCVGIFESVVGVPVLFFLITVIFLSGKSLVYQGISLVVWSLLATTLFGVSLPVVVGITAGCVLFDEYGARVLENRAMRIVLSDVVAVAITSITISLVWSSIVIAYSLLSLAVATVFVYRSHFVSARSTPYIEWQARGSSV